jgi:hypothetical protein
VNTTERRLDQPPPLRRAASDRSLDQRPARARRRRGRGRRGRSDSRECDTSPVVSSFVFPRVPVGRSAKGGRRPHSQCRKTACCRAGSEMGSETSSVRGFTFRSARDIFVTFEYDAARGCPQLNVLSSSRLALGWQRPSLSRRTVKSVSSTRSRSGRAVTGSRFGSAFAATGSRSRAGSSSSSSCLAAFIGAPIAAASSGMGRTTSSRQAASTRRLCSRSGRGPM